MRPEGTHFGGGGEQVNVQSGNLNFTIPVATAQGRNGQSYTVALNHNSQLWRIDNQTEMWRYGRDIGYGYGWRMLAGSITPIYRGWYDVALYLYTDSTGAEYRLDRRDVNGNWTTSEGIYLSYDDVNRKLRFYDGSFWLMGAESADAEYDAGTLYPTVMQDVTGNQIVLTYRSGQWSGSADTSGRLQGLRDVRSTMLIVPDVPASMDLTWYFHYTTLPGDTVEHLDYVQSKDGVSRRFSYHVSTTLASPWNAVQSDRARFLYRMSDELTSRNTDFWYNQAPNGSGNLTGELAAVILPFGGQIRWAYRDFTYNHDRKVREVQFRYIKDRDSQTEYTYEFFHNDTLDASQYFHGWTGLTDNTGTGDRVWYFDGPNRLYAEQRRGPGYVVKSQTNYAWAVSPSQREYIAQTTSIINDPGGTLSTQQEQTVDYWGNVTLKTVTDFGGGSPRSYKYEYAHETDGDYAARYVVNAMRKEWKWTGDPATSQLLKEVQYDTLNCNALEWPALDSLGHGPTLFSASPDPLCKFGLPAFLYDASRAAAQVTHYRTGVVKSVTNADGTKSTTVDTRTNWTAPSEIRVNSQLTTVNWDGMLNPSNSTNPNGGYSSSVYDMEGRLRSATGADGQSMTVTDTGFTKTVSTLNGSWERTTSDGFGRPKMVERGYDANKAAPQNVMTMEYEPCSCAPFGKLKRQSLKRQPTAAALFTVWTYDILGRTTQITHATGGATTYAYSVDAGSGRQIVRVTPPDQRWKEYRVDGFGDLREVVEPKPNNGAQSDTTSYVYDQLHRLSTVTMTRQGFQNGGAGTFTQNRSFTYDPAGRMLTNSMPEMGSSANGTVTFTYNQLGMVTSKTDARGRKTTYEYDSSNRLQYVKRYATATSAEDLGERTEYIYDGLSYAFLAGLSPAATDFAQANGIGRVVAIRSGSSVVELFAYTRGGQLQRKRTVAQGIALEVSYAYRTDGRLESVTYPSGRILKYGYGDWGKANSMQNPGGSEYQHATFDWNERLTAVAGETWQYTATGQLYRWQGSRDLTYNYDWPGGYKNGKLYQQVDNGTGKVTTYGYDLLGRLSSASSTAGWSQTYDFDGFGNLWRATGSGGAPSWDLSAVVNSAKNRVVEGGSFDDAGNHVWNLSVTYDYENRMRTSPSGTAFVSSSYDYSADNKRVIKRKAAGTSNEEWEVTLWANGQRMAVRNYGPGTWKLTEYSYFAGRRFSWDATSLNASMANTTANYYVPAVESADQLGSAVEHLPFGDQITATGGTSQKFTGYWRDGETGLDYADQRYYLPGAGRFMTADPYQASTSGVNDPTVPTSWNRYAYVLGDPTNRTSTSTGSSLRPQDEAAEKMLGFAAGTLTDGELKEWVRLFP